MPLSDLVLTLREKIEPKLIYSPFVRLIIFSPWFLIGFSAVVLTFIGVGLYLPKMWRVSPAGFEPVVQISGLDMTQNWSLKRNARKLEAEGKVKQALEAWQGAVAQNPADMVALHGALDSAARLGRLEDRYFFSAVTQMQWLLRINKTNQSDVALIARVADRLAVYDFAAYLFASIDKAALPPEAQAVLIKNLFYSNRIPEFVAAMETTGPQLKDPELKYYQLAHAAGWKTDPESAKAFAELERAVQSSENSERLGHLLLRAAAEKKEVDIFSRELDRLSRRNEAKLDHHALYWTLLAATGRQEEALRLAQAATVKPANAQQAIRVAQSYLTLGLVDNARELLKQIAPQYARTPELWVLYVNVLQMKEEWDGLRQVARTIRQDVGSRETLWGYSFYLDGRADLGEGRRAAAEDSFRKAAESAFDHAHVGSIVARELTAVGFPLLALQVFAKLEEDLAQSLHFWDNYYRAAVAAQDAAALLKATEKSHRLLPEDIGRLNNYAAALLINESRPEEAIQLTLQLYTRFPNNNAALINHSCALLLNKRASEARALLETVNVNALGAGELSQYYLTLFDTYHSLQMWEPAQRTRGLITESALFPVQRERLRAKDKQLTEIAKAA